MIERSPSRWYQQPAFIVNVTILALGLLGMSTIERALGIVLTKQPLPAKASMAALDVDSLSPYRVVDTFTIEDPELQQALGTPDYLQWVLDDPRRDSTDPARKVLLFVTYYALPDKVPHVPEECYLGSGYQRLATESLTLSTPAMGSAIPARLLIFGPSDQAVWSQAQRVPVVYLFRVNDTYAGNRDEARLALNKNLFGRASYFSKVELVFNRSLAHMSLEQVTEAAQALLEVVLPVLERDHWPVWPPLNMESTSDQESPQ